MTTYRTGNHWGVTIVREGEPLGENGKTIGDQLVAVVVNGDQALAERICALLNGDLDMEWRVTGTPRFYPWSETFTDEAAARAYIARATAIATWRDGPHLHRRTGSSGEWEAA